MSESVSPERAALLPLFEQTYQKISEQGAKHEAPAGAKRISSVAAWQNGDSREIGTIAPNGAVQSFALVNGKGYVETVDGMAEKDMERLLRRTADRVARTVPSTGEGAMYHHPSNGPPVKIF